jgi:uncharacterized lipoprotein YajG
MKKAIIFLLVAAVLFASCATPHSTTKPWEKRGYGCPANQGMSGY